MNKFLTASLLLSSAPLASAVNLISLTFDGTVTPQQQVYFSTAANFINSAITGYDLLTDSNGLPSPHALAISVSVPAIDGAGGILGSAGPQTANYYDNNPVGAPTHALFYSATGSMRFDSADVASLITNNGFYGVVLHEMMHVLGIGTLWTANNDVNGTNYDLYTDGTGAYTGPNALARWQAEFNQPLATSVPVELGGGGGTADGHWNEVDGGGSATGFVSSLTGLDFQTELMTGWASNSFFLSTVTLGGMDDLGYIVDYSKAGLITYVPIPEPAVSTLALAALAGLTRRHRRKL